MQHFKALQNQVALTRVGACSQLSKISGHTLLVTVTDNAIIPLAGSLLMHENSQDLCLYRFREQTRIDVLLSRTIEQSQFNGGVLRYLRRYGITNHTKPNFHIR